MPGLKNAFPQLEKVKEWVNLTAFLQHPSENKSPAGNPTIFLNLICLHQTWEF